MIRAAFGAGNGQERRHDVHVVKRLAHDRRLQLGGQLKKAGSRTPPS